MVKKIAIVGAGFAGLSAYTTLHKSNNFDTTLIDKRPSFEYTPSLPFCLNNPNYIKKITFPYKKYYKDFVQAEVTKITHKQVNTKNKTFDYDYLIYAAGSSTNFYENKSFEKNTYPLKTINHVKALNKQLKTAQNVTVVGGGYTGVEIAAELVKHHQVNLIHSQNKLLNNLPSKAGRIAQEYLIRNKAKIYFKSKVSSCTQDSITLSSAKTLQTDLIILAAGIKPNDELITNLNSKNIFTAGDCSPDSLRTGHHAIVHGKEVANKILDKPIKKHNQSPMLVSLGNKYGIIISNNKVLPTYLTGIIKKVVEQKTLFQFKKLLF